LSNADVNSPALLFDWSAFQEAAGVIGTDRAVSGQPRPPIISVLSEKSEREIPAERQEIFQRLLREGRIRLEYIQPGARSGAMMKRLIFLSSHDGDLPISARQKKAHDRGDGK
jgi:hypothetical protein